jgi:Family of unknown function (DUF6629)
MCFSPAASFAGGVIISAIGVATVKKIHKPSQILFACIPLFFGFQQFAEGVVWLTLPMQQHEIIQKIAVLIFLITALVIWPVMIPLAVMLMEKSAKKRKILLNFLLAGGILSGYYAYCLFSFSVSPRVEGFHIKYYTSFPESLAMGATIIYLIATIIPLFISSIKSTHWLGILMTLSCMLTIVFFKQYLTSVWCFFAALISGMIYWILNDLQKQFILSRFRLLKIHPAKSGSPTKIQKG